MSTTTFVWNSVDDCVLSELDGSNAVQAVYTSEPHQYGGALGQRRGATNVSLQQHHWVFLFRGGHSTMLDVQSLAVLLSSRVRCLRSAR